jgi:hypothetical protein
MRTFLSHLLFITTFLFLIDSQYDKTFTYCKEWINYKMNQLISFIHLQTIHPVVRNKEHGQEKGKS